MNLGLEPKDLNLLYTCFWDIDADDSGTEFYFLNT